MSEQIKTAAEAEEAAALAGLHEVHADPNARSATTQPMPKAITDKPAAEKSPAQWAYERMILYIKNFEEQLDASQEIAMGFAGGDAGVLRIEGIGYFDPDVLTFYGVDATGGRTQLVQHVSQLSVLLKALPKPEESPEPTRIGFRLAQELDKQS